MSLRELATHGDLLEASGGDAFIRFDIPQTLEQPGYALGQAIALPRKTHTRRLGLLVMGPRTRPAAWSAPWRRRNGTPPASPT